MLLIPDPAWGADGQGGLVDLPRGTGAVASLGIAGSTGALDGLIRDLGPVRMADLWSGLLAWVATLIASASV